MQILPLLHDALGAARAAMPDHGTYSVGCEWPESLDLATHDDYVVLLGVGVRRLGPRKWSGRPAPRHGYVGPPHVVHADDDRADGEGRWDRPPSVARRHSADGQHDQAEAPRGPAAGHPTRERAPPPSQGAAKQDE